MEQVVAAVIMARSICVATSGPKVKQMDAEFEGVVQRYDWLSREFHRLVTAKAHLMLLQRQSSRR